LWSAEANGALYYVLLRGWRLFADTEGTIRVLSAVFAVATVIPLYAIVRRPAGKSVAVLASLLLVTNVFWVHYAQEARSYSLAMFLVTLGTYLLLRALEERSSRPWVLFGCVMAAALYAHFYAIFVLVAQGAYALTTDREERGRGSLLGFSLPVLLGLPLAAFVLVNDNGQIDWLTRPGLVDLTTALDELVGDAGWPLLTLYLVLIVVAVASFFRRSNRPSEGRPSTSLLFLWLLVPVVAGFVVSQVKPIFYPRFLIVSLPALAAVAALGIAALRFVALQVAVVVTLIVLAATAFPDWYSHENQPWREMTALVAERSRPGDLMVLSPFARRVVEYYVERYGLEDQFPEPIWPPGEWGDKPLVFLPYPDGLSEIDRATGYADRVWFLLVVPDDPINDARRRTLDPGCKRAGTWERRKLELFECR
jgi:mannosyltransferase